MTLDDKTPRTFVAKALPEKVKITIPREIWEKYCKPVMEGKKSCDNFSDGRCQYHIWSCRARNCSILSSLGEVEVVD